MELVLIVWVFLGLLPLEAGNFHSIDSVRPRIGQRGTTLEVTISGSYLGGAQEVAFYRPGIRVISI